MLIKLRVPFYVAARKHFQRGANICCTPMWNLMVICLLKRWILVSGGVTQEERQKNLFIQRTLINLTRKLASLGLQLAECLWFTARDHSCPEIRHKAISKKVARVISQGIRCWLQLEGLAAVCSVFSSTPHNCYTPSDSQTRLSRVLFSFTA